MKSWFFLFFLSFFIIYQCQLPSTIKNITVGLVLNGIYDIVQGIPPTFAQIYTKILLQIDLRPLPYSVLTHMH